jgi:hypothetical protein
MPLPFPGAPDCTHPTPAHRTQVLVCLRNIAIHMHGKAGGPRVLGTAVPAIVAALEVPGRPAPAALHALGVEVLLLLCPSVEEVQKRCVSNLWAICKPCVVVAVVGILVEGYKPHIHE